MIRKTLSQTKGKRKRQTLGWARGWRQRETREDKSFIFWYVFEEVRKAFDFNYQCLEIHPPVIFQQTSILSKL